MKKSLEEKIMDISLESIEKFALSSFLTLIFDNLDLIEHNYYSISYKEKDLEDISSYIRSIFVKLESIIDTSSKEKEVILNECISYKNKLIEIAACVNLYDTNANILELSVANKLSLNEYTNPNLTLKDFAKDSFLKKCKWYFEQFGTTEIDNDHYSLLIGSFPCTMNETELANYMVQGYIKKLSEPLVSQIKKFESNSIETILPEKSRYYGVYFKPIADEIQKLLKINFSSLPNQEIENFFDMESDLFDNISTIFDYIYTLHSDLNSICVILSCMLTYQDIIGKNVIYTDLYKKALNMLNDENERTAFSESVLDEVQNYLEECTSQLQELSERQDIIFRNVDFNQFSVNTQTMISMEYFISASYYANIIDDIENHDLTEADAVTAEQGFVDNKLSEINALIIDSLIHAKSVYSKPYYESMISFIISSASSPFNLEEAMSYIEKSLDSIQENSLLATSIERASILFKTDIKDRILND